MTKKIVVIFSSFFLFFLFIYFRSSYIFALECNQDTIQKQHNENEWNEIYTACKAQETQNNSQIYDTQAQLRLINVRYDLSVVQMKQTEQKIESTEKEIEIISRRIDGLDNALDYLSKLLLNKVVAGYKNKSISVFDMLLDSQSANDLISRMKYMKTAQQNNQKLLVQVQETKLNFEEQKTLRDQKKAELDDLKSTLAKQQVDLENQRKKKDEDIAILTRNLAETQRILNIARQQLASFKSFVQTSGASSIISANSFGNGSDGSYYSQRDERWANQTIGYSSEKILDVGCLLSSVSMVAKKNGQNVTPGDVASDVSRFYGNTAWMSLPWKSVAGKSYASGVDIDQELQNGNYVIVGVGGCSNGGSHFVVLTKKDGDDYIMHDPIYGPDLKFSSHYSNICSAAAFK